MKKTIIYLMLLLTLTIAVTATETREATKWCTQKPLTNAWGYGTNLQEFERALTYVNVCYTNIEGKITTEGTIAITVWENKIMPQRITYNYKWNKNTQKEQIIDNKDNTVFKVQGKELLTITPKNERKPTTEAMIIYNKNTKQFAILTENIIALN